MIRSHSYCTINNILNASYDNLKQLWVQQIYNNSTANKNNLIFAPWFLRQRKIPWLPVTLFTSAASNPGRPAHQSGGYFFISALHRLIWTRFGVLLGTKISELAIFFILCPSAVWFSSHIASLFTFTLF